MPGRFTLGVLNINNIILAQAYAPSNIKLKKHFFFFLVQAQNSLPKTNMEHVCKYDFIPSLVSFFFNILSLFL